MDLCPRQLLQDGNPQSLMDNFASIFPSNSYNLGLEWTFWTFLMLNIIVLSPPPSSPLSDLEHYIQVMGVDAVQECISLDRVILLLLIR